MKRCTRCVMPETLPGIVFQDGVCNFCLSYPKERYFAKNELDSIIADARSLGKEYDCIVPLSGGRDSSFVLYVTKAVYGLKVLAVNYDNEFRTEQALVNMQRACETLGVPFVSETSRRRIARRIVRSQVRLALPLGLKSVIDGLCIACAYGYRSLMYRIAEKYQVPLIFWGESQVESTGAIHAVVDKASPQPKESKLRKLLRPAYYIANYNQRLQRLEFHAAGNPILADREPVLKSVGTREVRLFDYLPWDREQIKETVTRKLGWEKPADRVSTWRIDCRLTPLVNYCYIRQYGCSKACFGYCNMINSGRMSRDEALRQEEHVLNAYADGIPELLERQVGLKPSEVAKFMELK